MAVNRDDAFAAFGTSPSPAYGGGDGERKAVEDTDVELRVVLGTATLRIRDILKLGRGAVVELDRSVRSAADVYVAGYFVGRGEVTVKEDKMAVTLTDIFKSERSKRN